MKRIALTVTQEDIERGIPTDPEYCPVAYAWRRRLHLSGGVDVLYGRSIVEGYSIPHSEGLREFVQDTDLGRPLFPRRFFVTVPEALL